MQLNVKKIDEKLMTLAKMQSSLRNKKIDYVTFLEGNNLEFPPISNVLVTFPVIKRERNEIKNSHKRRSIVELDRYLETHHDKINQDDVKRIIFASPLRNRITFQKTFFRSSLYATVDVKKAKNTLDCSIEEVQKQKKVSLFTPFKLMQQPEKFSDFKAKLFSQISEKMNKGKTKYKNRFEENPQEMMSNHSQSQNKSDLKMERTNRLKMKNNKRQSERYSPWRSEDLEEELLL